MTYTAIGQVGSLSFGYGVTESYGYNSQSLQLTNNTATKGSTSLMQLNYSYQAAAGENGAGTIAGNAGQLMGTTGAINGATETAHYTYDLEGRLTTSSQTSNALSAQRRFVYDRWGNRTEVWDATSGGNQIQIITLRQSGGVPTNAIQSVNNLGSNKNYTYDSSGNLTNDGVHTYTYDAENRIVSVDNGTTAQYSYDQKNRRIKSVVSGTITHYIREGAKVLAEHNGSSGAVVADYIYSGSRLIAKVASGVAQYYLKDRLSVRVTLDANGNVIGTQGHLPFGEDFAETGGQEKHHFTSYERDSESGTDYALNRQFGQAVGRFNRPDPLSSTARKDSPQTWNRFAYSGNEPVNRTDPMGLFACAGCGGPFDICGEFGPTVLLDNIDIVDMFCLDDLRRAVGSGGSNEPAPPIQLPTSHGYLSGSCGKCLYSGEDNKSGDPDIAWQEMPANVDLLADFVATPRGVVKIPGACYCSIGCSNGNDYRVSCFCFFPRFGFFHAPRVITFPTTEVADPGKRHPAWVFRQPGYTRSYGGAMTIPVGFPFTSIPFPVGDYYDFN